MCVIKRYIAAEKTLYRVPRYDNNVTQYRHQVLLDASSWNISRKHFDTFQQVLAAKFLQLFKFEKVLFTDGNLNNEGQRLWCGVRLSLSVIASPQATVLPWKAKGCYNAGLSAISNGANDELLIVFSNEKWQLNSMCQCSRPWWFLFWMGLCSYEAMRSSSLNL